MSVTIRGIAASPGIAVARAYVAASPQGPRRALPTEARTDGSCEGAAEAEEARYAAAAAAARAELEDLRDRTAAELGELRAEIFAAHLSILRDPELSAEVLRLIREEGRDAVSALRGAAEVFIDLLSQVDDELIAARVADIKDVARRVAGHLEGSAPAALHLTEASVVVAEDLTPSETAQLDRKFALGFVTAIGSAVSHSSILARSLGIPAVVGVADGLGSVKLGTLLVVDGNAGVVIVDPAPEELAAYQEKLAAFRRRRESLRSFASRATVTADGTRMELAANIGGIPDLLAAEEAGAEGIGLFRTEFMYMDRASLPGEDEQYAVYRHVLERMAGKPVVIRTLDVGGDKKLDCLPMAAEANPFLGVRAIRLCLANEALFRTQLRALLRASVHGNLRILFPMIATVGELRSTKAMLAEERRFLEAAGTPTAPDIELGAMIEIPAAAVCADVLAREVDFFSVGSNDLTQYAMAADRMNPAVAYLHRGPHPAVLRLIAMAAAAAGRHGVRMAVCGELAADPLAAPLLAAMGIAELSMGAASIPEIRALLAGTDLAEARRKLEAVLEMEDDAQVRAYLEGAAP